MGISNVSSGLRSGVCTSTTRPSAPYEGQMIFETDTHRVLVWDNAAWVMIADTDQPPALSLIRTVSFSAATSASPVSVADVFTSDYDDYRVVLKYTATASDFTTFQFLNSGGVVSGSLYRGQVTRSYGTTVDAVSNFNASSWGNFAYSYGTSTSYSTLSCDIVSPNLNTPSSATTNFYCDNAGSSVNFVMNGGFMYSAQGVMTGFRIYPNSGNITGSISVYGYRK
jgi:hypothetical protein